MARLHRRPHTGRCDPGQAPSKRAPIRAQRRLHEKKIQGKKLIPLHSQIHTPKGWVSIDRNRWVSMSEMYNLIARMPIEEVCLWIGGWGLLLLQPQAQGWRWFFLLPFSSCDRVVWISIMLTLIIPANLYLPCRPTCTSHSGATCTTFGSVSRNMTKLQGFF